MHFRGRSATRDLGQVPERTGRECGAHSGTDLDWNADPTCLGSVLKVEHHHLLYRIRCGCGSSEAVGACPSLCVVVPGEVGPGVLCRPPPGCFAHPLPRPLLLSFPGATTLDESWKLRAPLPPPMCRDDTAPTGLWRGACGCPQRSVRAEAPTCPEGRTPGSLVLMCMQTLSLLNPPWAQNGARRDPEPVPPPFLPVGACEGLYLPRAHLP